jgi:hypothetical protein
MDVEEGEEVQTKGMENIFKPGTVAHYVILATQEAEIRRSMV